MDIHCSREITFPCRPNHDRSESVTATTDSGPVEGKYVYCIIRNDRSREFGEIGIGSGARVYTVSHKDMAAVVSDTPIVIYDPTRENVLAHEFVNETVMREFTLIPMSFGTIFRSESDVRALLNSTDQAFTDVFRSGGTHCARFPPAGAQRRRSGRARPDAGRKCRSEAAT